MHADKAVESIKDFPEGEAKKGLQEMVVKVMNRRK
jgi:geranylgeranyl pyrophosphate synthase